MANKCRTLRTSNIMHQMRKYNAAGKSSAMKDDNREPKIHGLLYKARFVIRSWTIRSSNGEKDGTTLEDHQKCLKIISSDQKRWTGFSKTNEETRDSGNGQEFNNEGELERRLGERKSDRKSVTGGYIT